MNTYRGMLAIVIGAITIVATLTVAAHSMHAQDFSRNPDAPVSDLPLADLQAFDNFAIAHPEIITDLGRNSRLIQDEDYLKQHPQLRDFLATHAQLRDELIDDPGNFIEPHTKRPTP